jgi:hypothetical protein
MNAMDTFVHWKNLEHFQKLIDEVKDEPLRKQLFRLLAEEKAKDLESPLGG